MPVHNVDNYPKGDELHEYYQIVENCYSDIGTARSAFGSTTTTEDEYDQMEKSLALMLLHCPEEISGIVYATLHEAGWRKAYHVVRWLSEKD